MDDTITGMKGTIMVRFARLTSVVVVVACVALLSSTFAPRCGYAENKDATEVGDWLQILLPVLAGTSTFIAGNPEGGLWDKEGTYQFIKSFGSAWATTTVWKGVAGKVRPESNSPTSFPSGHTTAAFGGAAFIGTRYGWKWGVPAYAGAIFTAWSRVQSDNHFADDVTAGASVALMYNWLFNTPQSETMSLVPLATEEGIGLQLMLTDEGSRKKDDTTSKKPTKRRPLFRYNFAFGPAFVITNEITSPSDTGTTFDLADNSEKRDDPITTAAVTFDLFLSDRSEFSFFWWPFESRDRIKSPTPISFAGSTFPANTDIDTSWRLYDVRGLYRYDCIPSDPWNLKLGIGVMWQEVEVILASANVSAGVEDTVLLPYVHGTFGYNFTEKLSGNVEANGISISNDYFVDAGAFLNYRVAHHWDFSAGYMLYAREIETSEIANKVAYNVPYLSVAYRW
jgi:hypothetical protein